METKQLIFNIFQFCDKYIAVEDFVEFEKQFAEIAQQAGIDLSQTYYGISFEELNIFC